MSYVLIAGHGSKYAPAVATSYSTSFDLTENPISESSRWSRTDTGSTAVRTTGGYACGTQSGSGGYDDSQAVLSGFSTDVEVNVTIFRHASISATNHEMEITMHGVETSSTTKKYEFLVNKDGGFQFMKWLGGHTFSDFVDLGTDSGTAALPGPPANGDTLRARIQNLSGTSVRLSLWYTASGQAEILIGQKVDDGSISGAAYVTGQPGIGFYIPDGTANPLHFGMASYSVVDI